MGNLFESINAIIDKSNYLTSKSELLKKKDALISNTLSDVNDLNTSNNVLVIDKYDIFDSEIHTWVNSINEIVIVVDPGHGKDSENVGTALTIGFEHKIKGSDGKPKIKKDKTFETIKSYFDFTPENPKFPDYVLADFKTWKVKRIASSYKTEGRLMFKVGVKLVEKLKQLGVITFNTRSSEELGLELMKRVLISNEKKAHYFISLHADGDDDHTITGSHTIYRESVTNKNETIIQREFSSDILEYYNKVTVVANSPKKDIRNLLILKDVNKAKRKTLIELGFVTNYDNYLNIENNIDEVANQLIIGIKKNIKNNFFKKGKILGYYDKVKGIGLVNKPIDFDATKNKNRYDTIYEKINIL